MLDVTGHCVSERGRADAIEQWIIRALKFSHQSSEPPTPLEIAARGSWKCLP
jgi:hypothetical protein